MLVIQQNCGKEYECTIAVLEAGLGLNTSVIYIQGPFLGNRELSHIGFNLYWPSGTIFIVFLAFPPKFYII